MRLQFAMSALLVCAAASAQTLTVDKLEQFLRSAAQREDAARTVGAKRCISFPVGTQARSGARSDLGADHSSFG